MKYIRTKDNIYELKEPYYIDKTNHLCWQFSLLPLVIHDMGEIIKQADTIEELFDTKVAIRKSNRKSYLGHFNGTFLFQEDSGWLGRVDSYEIIYGAIWVNGKHNEPILKSVAKMKGALPNGEIDWELL